jgi:hypothetical protein
MNIFGFSIAKITDVKTLLLFALLIFMWIILPLLIGREARKRGYSFIVFFLLSIFLSPIIGSLILILTDLFTLFGEKEDKLKCPYCGKTIEVGSKICTFCNTDIIEYRKKYIEIIKNSEFGYLLFPDDKNKKKNKTSKDNLYIVTKENPLKNTPDVNSDILITLSKDEIIYFISDAYNDISSKNIWYKVRYKQYEGWCLYKNIKKIDI